MEPSALCANPDCEWEVDRVVRFPALNEWVRVKGRKGVFLVVEIDHTKGEVGVSGNNEAGRVEFVPLTEILRLEHREEKYSI